MVVVRCLDTNLKVKWWLCIFLIIQTFNILSWYIFSYGALASSDEVSHKYHLDYWVFSMNCQGYPLPSLFIKTSRIYHLLGIKSLSPWGIVVPLCGFFGALWFIGMPFMLDIGSKFSISEEHVSKTPEILGGEMDTDLCNKLLLID